MTIHPQTQGRPTGIAERGVNAHGIHRARVRHHHRQTHFGFGRHFHSRRQFPARGIHHAQPVVGQFAPGAVQHQRDAGCRRFRPRPAHGQFHSQITRAGRRRGHHEILPHAIHAHRILLHQARPREASRGGIPTGHAALGQRGYRAALATHGSGHHPEAARRAGRGGTEPQTLGCRLPLQLLKITAQPHRAGRGLGHGQALAGILRRGPGPQVRPGNGLVRGVLPSRGLANPIGPGPGGRTGGCQRERAERAKREANEP